MPLSKAHKRGASGVRAFYCPEQRTGVAKMVEGEMGRAQAGRRYDAVMLRQYLAFMNRQHTRRLQLDSDFTRFYIVGMVLENHYAGDGRLWTISSLAALLHASVHKIRRHVSSLEAAGLVTTEVVRHARRVTPSPTLVAAVEAGSLDWAVDDLLRTAIGLVRLWHAAAGRAEGRESLSG